MLTSIRVVCQPVSHRTTWFFLEAQDADGTVGIGECSDAGTRADLEAAVDACLPSLPAACIDDIHDGAGLDELDRQLFALRSGLAHLGSRHLVHTVIGGLETALADLAAQRAGEPLWRFLGAAASGTVPLYANINRALRSRTPDEFAEVAGRAVEAGFRAVKCAPFDDLVGPSDDTASGLRCVRAVRQAVGPRVAVMVDVHHRLTYEAVLAALPVFEEIELAWLEDAVHIDAPDRLEDLANRTRIPLAGGELSWDVDEVVRGVDHGLGVVMPDVKHAGGLRRAQRMAAAVAPAAVSFHNPSGPVGTLASAHLGLACDSAEILEYAFGEVPWRPDCVIPSEQVAGGVLSVPDAPGLGARLASPAAVHAPDI